MTSGKAQRWSQALLGPTILLSCALIFGSMAFAQFLGGGRDGGFGSFRPPGSGPTGGGDGFRQGPGFFGGPPGSPGMRPPWMAGRDMPGPAPSGPTPDPRPGGDRGAWGGDPGDRSSRFEGFLRSLDTNRDGVIDPREIPEDRRRFFGFVAERAGIDPNRPVPIDRVIEMMRSRSEPRPDDRGRSDPGRPSSSASSQPQQSSAARSTQRQDTNTSPVPVASLIPGFGVSSSQAKALSFGEGISLSTSLQRYLTSAAAALNSGNAADSDRQRRIREFAESILRRNDRNNSGRLERDEWGELRGNPEEIDKNKDGVITREELEEYVAGFGRRREGSESSGGASPSPIPAAGSTRSPGDVQPAGTRFVRFRRPHELLPPGLPEWFISKDKDEDGQISMAEFAASWNDTVVAEFLRYDLDGDGIITPRECLAAMAGAVPSQVAGSAAQERFTSSSGGSGSGPSGGTTGGSAPASSPRASSSTSRSAWDDPGSNFW